MGRIEKMQKPHPASSPEEKRRWGSCERKLKYGYYKARKRAKARGLNYYECDQCGFYHLTKMSQKKGIGKDVSYT